MRTTYVYAWDTYLIKVLLDTARVSTRMIPTLGSHTLRRDGKWDAFGALEQFRWCLKWKSGCLPSSRRVVA